MKKVYALCGSTGIIKYYFNKSKAQSIANDWNMQSNCNTYYVVCYDVE